MKKQLQILRLLTVFDGLKYSFVRIAAISLIVVLCQPGVYAINNLNSGSVNGRIIDKMSNKPVEYAYVSILIAKDSSIVETTLTDSAGHYAFDNIKGGQYVITAQYVGHSQINWNVINVEAGKPYPVKDISVDQPSLLEIEVVAKRR
jgi:hypothetical protein